MNSIIKIYKKIIAIKSVLFFNFRLIKAIFLVVILVLTTNWLNQRHLSMVLSSLDSSYKDHVITQHYVYKLNHLFNLKRLQLNTNTTFSNNFGESITIKQLLTDFRATTLTTKESLHFNNLEKKYIRLLDLEESIAGKTHETVKKVHSEMNIIIDLILENIDALANIKFKDNAQLQLPRMNQKLLSIDKVLLKVEITFLIFIGIIVQLIIFYPRKSKY